MKKSTESGEERWEKRVQIAWKKNCTELNGAIIFYPLGNRSYIAYLEAVAGTKLTAGRYKHPNGEIYDAKGEVVEVMEVLNDP